jgi:hypothetical protein
VKGFIHFDFQAEDELARIEKLAQSRLAVKLLGDDNIDLLDDS